MLTGPADTFVSRHPNACRVTLILRQLAAVDAGDAAAEREARRRLRLIGIRLHVSRWYRKGPVSAARGVTRVPALTLAPSRGTLAINRAGPDGRHTVGAQKSLERASQGSKDMR